MFTYGFYNSVSGDRKYDAKQMSSIFDGIIKDGVFASIGTAMQVEAAGGLTVKVGIGRAWFNHTWSLNDAIMPLGMPNADSVFNRIDAVVLEVNSGDTVRENSIKIVQGVPATNPMRPTLLDQDPIWQHPLAYIYRPMGSTEILASQITNMVGSEETPFVSGILQTITLDQVLGQWRGELDEFVATKTNDLEAFYSVMQQYFGTEQADFETWRTAQEKAFNDWYTNVRLTLTNDVAGQLYKRLDNEAVERIFTAGLSKGDTTFNADGSVTCVDGNNELKITYNADGSVFMNLIYNGVNYTRTITTDQNGNINMKG